jgi:hypothetical protein
MVCAPEACFDVREHAVNRGQVRELVAEHVLPLGP